MKIIILTKTVFKGNLNYEGIDSKRIKKTLYRLFRLKGT